MLLVEVARENFQFFSFRPGLAAYDIVLAVKISNVREAGTSMMAQFLRVGNAVIWV